MNGLAGSNVRQVADQESGGRGQGSDLTPAKHDLKSMALRPGAVGCPVCQEQGMVAGQACNERTTVYWCLTLECPVRSFSQSALNSQTLN